MNIYCGNNAHHPDLVNGIRTLGTRHQCLRKGIQNGESLPVDPSFLLPYQPINPEKKYCGDRQAIPDGYDRMGGLYECYLSGVGVGKKKKAIKSTKSAKKSKKSKKSKKKSKKKCKCLKKNGEGCRYPSKSPTRYCGIHKDCKRHK